MGLAFLSVFISTCSAINSRSPPATPLVVDGNATEPYAGRASDVSTHYQGLETNQTIVQSPEIYIPMAKPFQPAANYTRAPPRMMTEIGKQRQRIRYKPQYYTEEKVCDCCNSGCKQLTRKRILVALWAVIFGGGGIGTLIWALVRASNK